MAFGENRIALGWFGISVSILGLILLSALADESLIGCCFWLVVSIIITSSGYDAKKKSRIQQVVYVQQPQVPVQQVIHHTYQQSPVVAQPVPVSQPVRGPAPLERKARDAESWVKKARNLELARDWDGAAQAYQKAGLYHEAGRIRQQYLEKDESGVNIQIQGGDTIHDSVIMRDDDSNL